MDTYSDDTSRFWFEVAESVCVLWFTLEYVLQVSGTVWGIEYGDGVRVLPFIAGITPYILDPFT